MTTERRRKALCEQSTWIEIILENGAEKYAIRKLGITNSTWRRWKEGSQVAFGQARQELKAISKKYESADPAATESKSVPTTSAAGSASPAALLNQKNKKLKKLGLYPVSVRQATVMEWMRVTDGHKHAFCDLVGISFITLERLLSSARKLELYDNVYQKLEEFHSQYKLGAHKHPTERLNSVWQMILDEETITSGFLKRDPNRVQVVRNLAQLTNKNERTIRRYLPPLAPEFNIDLKMLKVLEDVVNKHHQEISIKGKSFKLRIHTLSVKSVTSPFVDANSLTRIS